MSTNIDYHCHYTGSLSQSFFHQINPDKDIPPLILIDSAEWNANTSSFFNLYQLRQKYSFGNLTPKESYLLGSMDIAQSYFEEGVNQFQLRVGPKLSIKDTIARLDAMISGFEIVEAKNKLSSDFSKLVLTLIQNEKGEFINVNQDSLFEIFENIYTRPTYSNRVIGFDFSGPEEYRNFETTFDYIRQINNLLSRKPNGSRSEVMVHIGEYVDRANWKKTFANIETLIDLGVDRISHGTILWIDPQKINNHEQKYIAQYQKEILKKISQNNITIEICPTANLLLSPLEKYQDIPINMLNDLGVKFTTNTDNKSILRTTLAQEKQHIVSP